MQLHYLFTFFIVLSTVHGISQIPTWIEHLDTSTTFSSPRPVDLNGDNILDIVIGGGLDGSPESRGVVALDGASGSQLWNFPTQEEMFGSAQFLDITGDNVKDVFIGGRYAEFYAIDGATGSMLWEFFPHPPSEAVDSGWFNFYSPQFIPDQNSDGFMDLLVANGGNHSLPAWDTLRDPGMLLVIDALTGDVLARDTMPDGEETYCSAVVVDIEGTGVLDVLFGSGGENEGGHFYKVALTDLMMNDIGGAVVLASDSEKGFIAPPSVSDINHDGKLDIIIQGYNGTISAISGGSFNVLWEVQNNGTEASAAPVIGNFIGDISNDVFAVLAKGSAPTFFDYYQVMIDGGTGEVRWKDSISDLHFSSANALDLDLNGRDEVIVSLNYQTGAYYEHKLLSIDFQLNQVSPISIAQGGVNLGSTPLLCDLDSNGYIDIVYAFRADSVNPMGANGFKVNRLETAYPIPGVGIAWGGYMGTHFDGAYTSLAYDCGTLNLNLSVYNISCNGFNDGAASVMPTGGTPPYNYNWSTGSINDSIGTLTPGVYNVVVVDSLGCYENQSFTINDPYIITFSGAPPLICPGDSTSQVTVNSSGCPCMFSGCVFDWSNGDSTKTATGLWSGWHFITIIHTDGCITLDSVLIPEPSPVLDSAYIHNISCASSPIPDGAIELFLSNEGNTVISWDNMDSVSLIDSLDAGLYYVDLLDSIRGCTESDSFLITVPDTLLVTFTQTSSLCHKDSAASISLIVQGGIGPYEYDWNTGDSTSSIFELPPGVYQAQVSDSLGCINESPIITITSPDQLLTTNIIAQDTLGACQGEITTFPIGGTHPYSYSWIPSLGSTNQITGLCPGTYVAIITDSNGCQLNDTTIINSFVSINQAVTPTVKVFPNPARDLVTIILGSENRFTQIKCMNMLGQVEFLQNFKNRNQITLNTNPFSAGKYIIQLSGKNCSPILLPVLIE